MLIKDLIQKVRQANEQLRSTINSFLDEVILAELKNFPDQISKNLQDIQKISEQDTQLTSIVQNQMHHIHRLIEAKITAIEFKGEKFIEKNQSVALLGNILNCYLAFNSQTLRQSIADWHKERLWLEQQMMCKEQNIVQALHAVLAAIKEMANNDFLTSNRCSIFYAATDEKWVQIFLNHLVSHLDKAGINLSLEAIHQQTTDNFYQYISSFKNLDRVIIVGTQALFQQRKTAVANICNELILIERNLASKKGKALPILLSGTFDILPAYFFMYSNVADWCESSYVSNLKKLLADIYAIDPNDFEYQQIWEKFEKKYPILTTGFPPEAIQYQELIEDELKLPKELDNLQATQMLILVNEPYPGINNLSYLTWEDLIQGVKNKYIKERQFKTIFGETQEIAHAYINLSLIGEKEQEDKERALNQWGLTREQWLDNYEEIQAAKSYIQLQNIFKPLNKKRLNSQLILGQAGVGKSVMSQYLAYQWAKKGWWQEEPFKLLIWITLNQLTNEKTYPKEGKIITLGQVFYEQYKHYLPINLSVKNEEAWIDALDQLINAHPAEILYVLDGFDEVANICLDSQKTSRQTEILALLLKQERVIITSRPGYIDHYLHAQGIKIDRRLENVGFTDNDVKNYVHHYPWKTPEQKATLQTLLYSHRLMTEIIHIPLHLTLLCRYWNTQTVKEHNIRMTDLYEDSLSNLLFEYLTKNSHRGFSSSNPNHILSNEKVQLILQFLEKLAFLQMQEKSLTISKERIINLLEEMKNQLEGHDWKWFKSVLGGGLLVSADSQEKRFEEREEHRFIHSTFQEFLAARYIARLFKEDDAAFSKIFSLENNTLHQKTSHPSLIFMQKHKYDLHYERVWRFVAGLLKEDKKGIQEFFNNLLLAPRELLGYYDVLLWIKCLEESKLTSYLGEVFKENLIFKIKKKAQAVLDSKSHDFKMDYLETFFEYLYSSPLVHRTLGILKTKEAIKRALDNLRKPSDFLLTDYNNIYDLLKYESWTLRIWILDRVEKPWELSANTLRTMLSVLIGKSWIISSTVQDALSCRMILSLNILKPMEQLLLTAKNSTSDALSKQLKFTDDMFNGLNLFSGGSWTVKSTPLDVLSEDPHLSDEALNKNLILLNDKSHTARSSALEVLGRQRALPSSVVNTIISLLDDQNWSVRTAALYALAHQFYLSPTIWDKIISLLSDQSWSVRTAALDALSRHRDLSSNVLDRIASLLLDENTSVKSSALHALGYQLLPDRILNNIATLLSNDEIVKCSALNALGYQRDLPSDVLDKMVNLLSDKSTLVKCSAVNALSHQKDLPSSTLNKMINLINNECNFVQEAAINALGRQNNLPSTALDKIISLLGHGSWGVTIAALDALGRRSHLPVNVLNDIHGLLSRNAWSVRDAALEALGKQANLPFHILDTIFSLLNHHAWNTRSAALNALSTQANLPLNVLNKMVTLLSDQSWDVRSAALNALGKQPHLSSNILDKMVNLLNDQNWDVICSALNALTARPILPSYALNKVVSLLNHECRNIKCSAINALRCQRNLPSSVLNTMFSLLNDETWLVRSLTLDALIHQKALPANVVNDIAILLNDTDYSVSAAALVRLGYQRNLPASILNSIVYSLNDTNEWMRAWALGALACQKNLPSQIMNNIVNALSDQSWAVRYSALDALGDLPNLPSQVVNNMANSLNDKSRTVRYSALDALGRQRNLPFSVLDKMASLLNDKDLTVKSSALEALGEQSNLPFSILKNMIRFLNDEKAQIRNSAQAALSRQVNLPFNVLNILFSLLHSENKELKHSVLKVLCQVSLPLNILNSVFNLLTANNIEDWVYEETVHFINQHLMAIFSHQEMSSKLVSLPTLLVDVILENNFSNKNVAYFENVQTLIIRLDHCFKKIVLNDNGDRLVQIFMERRKVYLNKHTKINHVNENIQIDPISNLDTLASDKSTPILVHEQTYTKQDLIKEPTDDCLKTIKEMSELLTFSPYDANAYCQRAWAYLFLSKIDLALNDVEQIMQLNKNSEESYCIHSLIYFAQGNLKEAMASCQSAIKLKSDEGYPHFILAHLYHYQGMETAYQENLAQAQQLKDDKHLFNLLELWLSATAQKNPVLLTRQSSTASLSFSSHFPDFKAGENPLGLTVEKDEFISEEVDSKTLKP